MENAAGSVLSRTSKGSTGKPGSGIEEVKATNPGSFQKSPCTDCTLLRCRTNCPISTCAPCTFKPTTTTCDMFSIMNSRSSYCPPSPLTGSRCPPSPLCGSKCPPSPLCGSRCPPSPLSCSSPRYTLPPRCFRCCEVTNKQTSPFSSCDPCKPKYDSYQSSSICSPCTPKYNPCAPRPDPCRPCAPRLDPCKPCAPMTNPCDPCAPRPDPCKPCAAMTNPCDPCARKPDSDCLPPPCSPPPCSSPPSSIPPPEAPKDKTPPKTPTPEPSVREDTPPPITKNPCPPSPPIPHCCPSDVELERAKGFKESITGKETWGRYGVRIYFTEPISPGTSTGRVGTPLTVRLGIEVKASSCLSPDIISAYMWTHMRTMCNPCGTWKDLPLHFQPHETTEGECGVKRYVYSSTLTPIDNDTFRLTFNIKWGQFMIWANSYGDDNMVGVQ